MKRLYRGRNAAVMTVAAMIISAAGASAQQVITLRDAIDIALTKGYDMKALRLQLVQAEQNLVAAKNSFKTNADMSINAPKWTESISSVDVANSLPVYNRTSSEAYGTELTVTQPLPTDGTLSLTSSLRRTRKTVASDTTTSRGTDFVSSMTLEFTQPLFTINSIQLNLKNAELNYETAVRSRTRQQLEIIYEVSQSFYDLYQKIRNFEIIRETVEQQSKTTETAKQKFDAGLIAEVEYLQMEVDLSESRDELVSAEASMNRQLDTFKQLIGLDAKDNITLKTGFEYSHVDINLDKAIEEGLKNRSEIREREIEVEQLRITLKETDAKNAISGELTAYYDLTGVSDSDLAYDTSLRDLFDSSWRDLERRPRNRGVTFSLDIPIWDWGVNRAQVKAAEAKLRDAELRRDEAKKTIVRNITDVVTQVRDAESRIEISRRRQELAQRTFDISLERFAIGEITADDLAQDRTRLNNAKMAFLTAYINYQLAIENLKRNTLWDFSANSPVQ